MLNGVLMAALKTSGKAILARVGTSCEAPRPGIDTNDLTTTEW